MSGESYAALKSWKTFASSLVTVVFGFIAASPEDFHQYPLLVHLAKYLALGGFAALGWHAQDAKGTPPSDKCDSPKQ
jgi:hypothetical protein